MSRFVRSLFTVALTLLTLVTLAPKGSADTLVDHPVGPKYRVGISSSYFSDNQALSTFMFNKLTVPKGGWLVSQITLYGLGSSLNLPADPTSYLLLGRKPDMTAMDGTIYTGQQVVSTRYTANTQRQDLVFDFPTPLYLSEGTYWLSGYSGHSFNNGGWWFQRAHDTSASDVGYYQNPWGAENDPWGTKSVTLPDALRGWGGKNIPNVDGALQVVGTVPQGKIVHVVPGGVGDGSSWASASGDIISVLTNAQIGDQVWVAKGDYTVPGGAWVGQGVKLYGGFAGTEPDNFDITQRNLTLNRTTLRNNPGDGTVLGAWGAWKLYPQDTSQVIDGFTTQGTGLGIAVFNTSATISNNRVIGMSGNWTGGIQLGSADGAVIQNNLVDSNVGPGDGGGVGVFNSAIEWGVGGVNWNGNPYIVAGFKPTWVTVDGNTLTNNSGRQGGGAFSWYSRVSLANNLVKNNISINGGTGGGINAQNSDVLIENNIVQGNSALPGGWDPSGGGISVAGWDGYAPFRGKAVIQNNFIADNTAVNSGGGISHWGNSTVIQRNRIVHNTAFNGSAIQSGSDNEKSYTDINNNIVADNVGIPGWNGPDEHGWTVVMSAGFIGFTNNTLVNNSGYGLMYVDASAGIFNNIFANNPLDVTVILGNFIGVGEDYNVMWQNGPGGLWNGAAVPPGSHDLLSDPLLDGNYRPANYSPTINAGDDFVVDPMWKDYFGSRRKVAGRVDIGAVEVQNPGADTTLTIANVTGAYSSTKNLVAKIVRTADKIAVVGETVYFKLGSTTLGKAVTDATGKATLPYKLIFNVGNYPITVSYKGTPQYNKSAGAGSLTIIAVDTSIACANATGTIGQTRTLTAILKRNSDGGKLGGRLLTFSVDGNVLGTSTTDASGKATMSYKIDEPMAVGAHTWGASFAGDSNHNSSAGSANLTVNQSATALKLSNASAKVGVTVNLIAKLKRNSDGMLLANRQVTFSLDGAVLGVATTDANGVAVLAYGIPADATKGAHPIVASFDGDSFYLASLPSNATLTVK